MGPGARVNSPGKCRHYHSLIAYRFDRNTRQQLGGIEPQLWLATQRREATACTETRTIGCHEPLPLPQRALRMITVDREKARVQCSGLMDECSPRATTGHNGAFPEISVRISCARSVAHCGAAQVLSTPPPRVPAEYHGGPALSRASQRVTSARHRRGSLIFC
jgi:hypothetical protein